MFEHDNSHEAHMDDGRVGRFITRCKQKERPLILSAIALQIALLATMTLARAAPFLTDEPEKIVLVPVDIWLRRDLLHDQQARLRYDFSYVPDGGIDGIPARALSRSIDRGERFPPGTPVFVTLVPEPGGRIWRSEEMSFTRPASGTYLAGRLNEYRGITYGLKEFDVPDGDGPRYRRASRADRTYAEIAITNDGLARLRGLRIGPVASNDETLDVMETTPEPAQPR